MQNRYRTQALSVLLLLSLFFGVFQRWKSIDLSFQLENLKVKQELAAALNSGLKLEVSSLISSRRVNVIIWRPLTPVKLPAGSVEELPAGGNVMSEFNQAVLITSIGRLAGLICGSVFAFLGYKLFVKGYFEKAGELNAIWGKQRLVLKQVAPGVFFALLGTAVILISTQHPMEVSVRSSENRSMLHSESPDSLVRLLAVNPSLQFCRPELGPLRRNS